MLPFWQRLPEAPRRSCATRGVPAEELESFRWLIEELRVSLFAPELKAAVPVSAQRLTEQWKRLLG